MLTPDEAEALGNRLDNLKCTDPTSGNGLFTYVMKGEPEEQSLRYKKHLLNCEYCCVALEIYRYKKNVAQLLAKRR